MRSGIRGFTLIELLVVVSLISILAVIALPNFGEATTRSKVAATKSNMRTVAIKMEMHNMDLNRYPLAGKWRWILLYKILYWLDPLYDEPTQEALFLKNYGKLYGPYQDVFELDALKRYNLQDAEWLVIQQGSHLCHGYNFFHPAMMVDANRYADWEGQDQETWRRVTDMAGGWLLYSCGPDLIVESPNYFQVMSRPSYTKFDEGYTDKKLFIEYDPTNGTISNGNIFRTQKNPAGLGTHPYFYTETAPGHSP